MQFRIFPCNNKKEPLVNDWQVKATRDQEQIRLWQEIFKDQIAYWSVPTGQQDDLLVLDVDVKKHNGYETLKSLTLPPTMTQRTLSGGMHLLFKYPKDGKHYGNRVNFLPGLDIRGNGGYICFYGTDELPLAEPPQDLLTKASSYNSQSAIPQNTNVKLSPELAILQVQESLDNIKNAPAGESNNTLNTESFKLGQLVASGSITREYAERELFQAAKLRGKPDREAWCTIKSGLDGGAIKPLSVPFPELAPPLLMQMGSIVQPRWTPPRLTMEDLTNVSALRKPQLFEDWSTEDIHLTVADGGTGKTTLKLYEAICLALGERFLGFNPKQRGKTLFITGEDTDKKLAAMLGAIMRQMGLFEERPDNEEKVRTVLESIVIKKDSDLCLIVKDRATGFLHPNPLALNKILEAVEDVRPKMIVIDPIAAFWGSESALNDMAKAVSKLVSELVEKSGACVDMINHMGKNSSSNKDVTQFAGRGGSGLPSHSRVVRSLHMLNNDEYMDLTGETLDERQTAMEVTVSKFSDGSPLLGKPFVIVRDGYLFHRKTLSKAAVDKINSANHDQERVLSFITDTRSIGKYPNAALIKAHFASLPNSLSAMKVQNALALLVGSDKIRQIENPDQLVGGKVFDLGTQG